MFAAVTPLPTKTEVATAWIPIRPTYEIDPKFAGALRGAASAGVRVLGCAVEMTGAGARDVRRIPVSGSDESG
jgi:DNA-binding sugar fermentation-stimulating protein